MTPNKFLNGSTENTQFLSSEVKQLNPLIAGHPGFKINAVRRATYPSNL